MAENKREVNFEEVISLSEDNEQKEEIIQEEKETLSESSPDENQTEESSEESKEEAEKPEAESEEETEESSPESDKETKIEEVKPVEGESIRERAFRAENKRLRELLRKTRGEKISELFGDIPKQEDIALSDEEQKLLEQYDPEEVKKFEQIVDIVGKKKGWVKKQEFQRTTYQQQIQDTLDNWIENHPEYFPENDKDNVLWNRFQHELTYYKLNPNSRHCKNVFDKVHQSIFGISKSGSINIKQINAQREKIKVASHSGQSPGSPKSNRKEVPQIDPNLGEYLKGFSDEEKKEILGG